MESRKHMSYRYILLIFAATLLPFVTPVMAQESCTTESPCEVDMWVIFGDHRLDWTVDAANRFNEQYPQYNVVVENPGNYTQIVDNYTLIREEGGEYPAIVQVQDIQQQFALDSGFFVLFEDVLNGRTEVLDIPTNLDDIIDGFNEYYTLNGKLASFAWNSSTPIAYHNMDLWREAGLEEPPLTWQELRAACEGLRPMIESGELEACASWPFTGWFVEQWMSQQNETWVSNGNGREGRGTEVILDGPGMIAVTDFYLDMVAEDFYLFPSPDYSGTLQLFNQGRVAMTMASSADARFMDDVADEVGIDMQTALMIHNGDVEGGWNGNPVAGASMWISNGLSSEVEDGALAFLLWLSNTENSASWHTASGYVPVRDSSVELLRNLEAGNEIFWDRDANARVDIETEDWFAANPNYLTASEQLAGGQVTLGTLGPVFGTMSETRTLIQETMERIVAQELDPATELALASEQATELLQEYNLLFANE
jgi:sn-glycerol 3-phosphate transport system substrate-binding protein